MGERSGGIGIVGLLGVAFVILKLCGVIDWPWLWVLAPFWVGLVMTVVVCCVAAVVLLTRDRMKIGRRR